MSQEYTGVLAGGCHHVWSACYHIAVVQLVLGQGIQTGSDGRGIVQTLYGPLLLKAAGGTWTAARLRASDPANL